MEGSGAPSGVAGGVPRDDAGASRAVVEGCWGKVRSIPKSFSLVGTPVQVWYSGADSFSVHVGEHGAEFVVWTDVRGIDAMIDSLLAAKVNAQIARDIAGVGPLPRFTAPLAPHELDPADLPF